MGRPLLDDPDFLAELEKLDIVRPERGSRDLVHHPTLDEWAREQGLVLPVPDDSTDPPPPERGERMLTALMFVGLMVAGAGMAAMVFQDRVELILSSL